MSASRTSTIEPPRKSAGAFFHWETPDEPISVYFHLNIVDLLERDFCGRGGASVAGVLLGRIERGRKLALIVEDYECTPNLVRLDTTDSAFGDRHLLEEIVDRWHSRPEKRISILGFYRSCPQGQVFLSKDDLEILSAHPKESERIFLLIEPQVKNASRGTLYMVRDGVAEWKWHSVSFSRKELTERGVACQSPNSGLQGPSPQSQKVPVPEKEDVGQRSEKNHKALYKVGLALGSVAILMTVPAGILPSQSQQLFRALAGTFSASKETPKLVLRLQRVGNDWQVSWDPTGPFLLKAVAGHLLITDGFIHKSVDLDMGDLRSGSVMYTPSTDNVVLRLDVINAESVTLASATARMVTGLLPSPDHVQGVGYSSDTRTRAEKAISLGSGPTSSTGGSAGKITPDESSIARSFPPKVTIPLTMRPPVTSIESPQIVNLEASVAQPNYTLTLRGTDTLAASLLPPAPSVSDLNASGSNPNLPSSARPVSQSSEAEVVGVDKPAKLITRKDPIYSELAKKFGESGTVQLQLRVGVSGRVESARVVKGPPILAQAALQAVKMWRYIPAQVKGTPVTSEVLTNIVFKLD